MIPLLPVAIISGALSGSMCSAVGVLCNRMKLSTIVFAVAHGALAGAALSLLTSLDPILLGVLMALLTAAVLGPLADSLELPIDIVSMTLFSIYNALTFLFIVLAPGPVLMTERVGKILWGSVLAVSTDKLILLATLTLLCALFFTLTWRRLTPILFDRRLAEAEGLNTKPYVYSLLALSGVVITLSLTLVGGFLVFSLLYLPAAGALQISEDVKKIIVISASMGALSAVMGVAVSFLMDLPVGCCIVISAAVIFVVSAVLGFMRRKALILEISR